MNNCKYIPGVILRRDSDNSMQMLQRTQVGYRAYYRCRKYMQSKKLNIKTKFETYGVAIRLVALYGTETRNLTNMNEENLSTFQRNIVRRTYI